MHGLADVVTVPGDVTDPAHRADLAAAVGRAGGLDVLVNNASPLGPSPQPLLRDYPLDELGRVYDTNVFAPLALIQLLTAPLAAAAGTIVNVSSDAAVEAYPGWGGYGSSKAALDQLTAVLGAEEPSPALLRARPRRHAHGHASAGVPRRGHLGLAGAGDGHPGAAAAAGRAAAERPLPRKRPRRAGGDLMRLAASQPPEARGLGRDGVRLLVATPDGMVHARFGDLPRFLSAGDLLVVNTSATIAAAVDGRRGDGRPVVVHFSSPLDEGTPWAGTLHGRSPEERALDARECLGHRPGRERPARHLGWSSCGRTPRRPGP